MREEKRREREEKRREEKTREEKRKIENYSNILQNAAAWVEAEGWPKRNRDQRPHSKFKFIRVFSELSGTLQKATNKHLVSAGSGTIMSGNAW